jgi:hypothetical protein
MIASDDDIDVPMCLARADEVAYGAVSNVFAVTRQHQAGWRYSCRASAESC